VGCAEDIEGIDGWRIDFGDAERYAQGDERMEEVLALGWAELFGVVEALEFGWQTVLDPVEREDDRGGDDGSGEGSATGLIDAGYRSAAIREEGAFEGKAVDGQ
jgi:hypothetical protein